MAYIVIFESDDAIVKANLVAALKRRGDWAELTSQSYLLDTQDQISRLMEALQPLLGPTDSLWVFTPRAPWSGHGDPIVDDYVHSHIGEAQDYIPKDWDEASGSRL